MQRIKACVVAPARAGTDITDIMASKSAPPPPKRTAPADDAPSMEEILNSIRGVIGEDSAEDAPEVEVLKVDDDIMELTEEWVEEEAPPAAPPLTSAPPPAPAAPPKTSKPAAQAAEEKARIARPELLDELLKEDAEDKPAAAKHPAASARVQSLKAESAHPDESLYETPEAPEHRAPSARLDKPARNGAPEMTQDDNEYDFAREDLNDRRGERSALLSENAAAQSASALKELLSSIPKPRHDSPALRADTTLEDLVVTAIRPYLAEWLNRNLPDIVKQLVYKEIRKLIPEEE